MREPLKTHAKAWAFFRGLQEHIQTRLPPAAELRSLIARIVAGAKASTDRRYMAFPEGALLNEFVAPAIHDYFVSRIGMSASDATRALLSESFRSLPGIASASPARSKRHPFGKALVPQGVDHNPGQWRA